MAVLTGFDTRCHKHPDTPATMLCGACQQPTCLSCAASVIPGREVCVDCQTRGYSSGVPWEQRKQLGLTFWQALVQTTRMALTRPTEFYAAQSSDWVPAFTYGLTIYTLALLVTTLTVILGIGALALIGVFVGGKLGAAEMGLAAGAGVAYAVCITVMTLFQAPIQAALGIGFAGALSHVSLMVGAKSQASWGASFRAVSYANAVYALYAIPICGWLALWPWMIYLEAKGLSAAHRVSMGAAVAAALAWRVLMIGLVLLLYAALFAAAFAAEGFKGF